MMDYKILLAQGYLNDAIHFLEYITHAIPTEYSMDFENGMKMLHKAEKAINQFNEDKTNETR